MSLSLPVASAQTDSLDDALEAYESGHYRLTFDLARRAGQEGSARALELAASMQWQGARLYGVAVPGDRGEAVRLLGAAVALDRDRQLSAAPFYLALAARADVAPTPDESRRAAPELIAMYGAMILHGVLSAGDLRDHASANCDYLSPGDLAAVQQWLARTGVYCDWPE